MADEVAPFLRIQKRVAAILKTHGLLTAATTFTADPQGIQIITVTDPDFREPDPELDELEGIEQATKKAERKARDDADAEKARRELEGLREQLRNPNEGIL